MIPRKVCKKLVRRLKYNFHNLEWRVTKFGRNIVNHSEVQVITGIYKLLSLTEISILMGHRNTKLEEMHISGTYSKVSNLLLPGLGCVCKDQVRSVLPA